MSTFWSWWVVIITLGNIVACYWLIRWASRTRSGEAAEGDVTGHTWDDNLQEYNNPLPSWWLWMFYLTIVFGFIYMALYPALGNYKGMLGWTSTQEYQAEMKVAEETYGPIFAKYANTDVVALSKDDQAMQAGQRLFLTYCATCHGSDAGGAKGFPNLTDKAWIWGGTPEAINATIMNGRMGVMPSHAHLPDEAIDNLTSYVMHISGRQADANKVMAGEQLYNQNCVFCHGPGGVGNQAAGFPNLTDKGWIYGSSEGVIKQTIKNGRNGQMPAHGEFLGKDKVHLLTAYVYSLSN